MLFQATLLDPIQNHHFDTLVSNTCHNLASISHTRVCLSDKKDECYKRISVQQHTKACTISSADERAFDPHFYLRNELLTVMSKFLRQCPILDIGDMSTSIRRARQHHAIPMNEGNGKNNIFRVCVGRSMLI
jgi:hypothetical protein